MIENYIPMVRKLVLKHGSRYFGVYSLEELLSYAYEALIRAYDNFNGCGDPSGWISYKIKKAMAECGKHYRRYPGISSAIEFIELDESMLSTNGYEVQRMIDRQYIECLMERAKLTKKLKRRLWLYYFDEYTYREIADIEGVSESAIWEGCKRAIEKMQQVLD